jgi:hypothetical protein
MRTGFFGLSVGFFLFGSVPALAHSTGHESRTKAECQKLPGTARRGERGNCLRCVQRPKGKWHYHPDYKGGKRCRPDNGKP